MTTIYDAVDVAAIPASATTILAYIDGNYVTYPAARKRFPSARILTVTTSGKNAADICDVESQDATPAIAAAGVRAGLYHTVYSDVSTKPALDSALSGLAWQWYAAHPTGVPHLEPNSVATQYAWPGYGSPGNYDISMTNGTYPNAPAPQPAPPVPQPPLGETEVAQSPVFQFKAGQLDVIQVSGGYVWHKWNGGGGWANEVLPKPAGVTYTGTPEVAVLGGACWVTVEDTNSHVWTFLQTSTGSTWNEGSLP